MKLQFSHLFFIDKKVFPEHKLQLHEAHHKKTAWVYFATLALGFWLIANPLTFEYQQTAMLWSDLITGLLVIIFSIVALSPYRLWAQWILVFLGIWLFIAPMVFWTKESSALLLDYLTGTLLITFGLIVPGQPGLKLYEQSGPNVPKGWDYNPSSWSERVPVIFLSWVGFFVARYMGTFQLEIIDTAWDPFFGNGTEKVLTSDVSHAFPVSDALLGAFSYLLDILFAYAGNSHRWRTMPWVVILFGILIIPLGIVSITLIILQPLSVGFWCTLCLVSAMVSLIMIPFAVDEVLATIQLIRYEKKERNTPFWTVFWFGGTMEGSMEKYKEPNRLFPYTLKGNKKDILSRPWNLFLSLLVGMWVMASPAILDFEGPFADHNNVAGALIITFGIIAMSDVARSVRLMNVIVGLWLIVIPWTLDINHDVSFWSSILSGAAIILLSIRKGIIGEKRGGFENHVV